jgi:signal transduction histidine kinase
LEMRENEAGAPGQTDGKAPLCSSMVRQVVKSVDEIVWAINPRNDRLQYLCDYMIEFAVEFLQSAAIRPEVDLPEQIPDQTVSPEARHNLFLVVKEALNNIVRHARASKVHFKIATTDKQLSIVIQDNGRGFKQAPDNASADGLRNLHHRMKEIGGECRIESQAGAGTRVSLSYPWPRNHH